MNKKLLTIFIPTYNRLYKLKEIIAEILKYEGNDIEVILSDDSDNDDVKDYIENINSKKIFYFRRDKENFNPYRFISYNARGKYTMWLLDKDIIVGNELYNFMEFLRKNVNIMFGRCLLSFDKRMQNKDYIVYNNAIDSLSNIAYIDWHPSGVFLRTKMLDNIYDLIKKPPILVPIIFADLSLYGCSVVYQRPLIRIENLYEARKVRSFSHLNKENDLFVSPHMRNKELKGYIIHIENMGISNKNKTKLLGVVIERLLNSATLGYAEFKHNKFLCKHYGVQHRNIGTYELYKISFEFQKDIIYFILKEKNISLLTKYSICLKFIKIFFNNSKMILARNY